MSKTTIPTGGITADAIDATLIADDAVSEEHLDNTALTGFSELTSLADADKFLISDASDSNNIKYVQKSNMPSGTHTLLESIDISSNTGNVDTSNFFSTSYRIYYITGFHVRTSSDNVNLLMRFKEVGGSVKSATNYKYTTLVNNLSGVTRNDSNGDDAFVIFHGTNSSVDNGGMNFGMYVMADRGDSSSGALQIYWNGGGSRTSGHPMHTAGGGWYDAVTSNDPAESLRFTANSGDISFGRFRIYGVSGS